MTEDAHDPASYRLLFGVVGAGLLVLVLVFILASALVVPAGLVLALVAMWLLGSGVAFLTWRTTAWAPLAAGTALAVIWIAAITIFAGPA